MNKIILLLLAVFIVGCQSDKVANKTNALEIHIINVQQGDATLVIGPNGTTLLIDGGKSGKGTGDIVPYLSGLGISATVGLDYMLATHLDADHIGGLDEVIKGGYQVKRHIWFNGSAKTGTTAIDQFFDTATSTPAGKAETILLGEIIDLGNGAKATAVAVGGRVLGFGDLGVADENDKSVALLIQYNAFDYITAGDLGGGQYASDNNCTGRVTSQENVETTLVASLMPGGGAGLLTANGVEVLHVNHHGSESSTNFEFMNLLTPKIAVIQTGAGQGSNFNHPREDILNVLMKKVNCITAQPALVLQTDEGDPIGTETSKDGHVVGDIVIKTNGVTTFQVSG
jgi:beta-lactamase superfamily II metal-dependent hydrolase